VTAGDRQRWNAKHAAAPEHAPEPFVLECLAEMRALPAVRRTALDVACGAGRHALLLARQGFDVLAVDVSDVAVALLRERAAADALRLRAARLDLDEGLPAGTFDVVTCTHFLDRSLWPALREAVAPGGLLLFQTFTAEHAERTGFPRRYCLDTGELLREVASFEVLRHRIEDDGRLLESVLAQKR